MNGVAGQAMKIYMLLMLVGVFVGFSYPPVRSEVKTGKKAPPGSLPA